MSVSLAMVSLLLAAEPMQSVTLEKLSFKAPKNWEKSIEGAEGTWKSAEGEFSVSVFPVDPKRDAKLCVSQLAEAIGKDGATDLKVGGQPALRKVATDYIGAPDAGRTEEGKTTTVTVVGCNGSTKWLMTFATKASNAVKFGVLTKSILDSVSYGK